MALLLLAWKAAWRNLALLVPVLEDGIKSVHVSETFLFKVCSDSFSSQVSSEVGSVFTKY